MVKDFVRQLDSDAVQIQDSRLPPPVITYLGRGAGWRLEHPYSYQDGDHRLTVPGGFEFDLASIPRWFWWAIAPFELSVAAPLLHDFIYQHGGRLPDGSVQPPRTYTRQEADRVFRDIMVHEGVPGWRRTIAYAAVRAFGWTGWRR